MFWVRLETVVHHGYVVNILTFVSAEGVTTMAGGPAMTSAPSHTASIPEGARAVDDVNLTGSGDDGGRACDDVSRRRHLASPVEGEEEEEEG